jgi:deoxyguanosine kinase
MNQIDPSHRYVVVEGNIGSGKTSFATRLSERLSARLVLEQFSDNPFLPKFYEDASRYAFPLEMSFLAERYHQHREEVVSQNMFQPITVADYMLTKSLIFSRINLTDDEFELYRTLFSIIHGRLPRPDIILYINISVDRCLRQIAGRGRSYEQSIDRSYLTRIHQGYMEAFLTLTSTPVVAVDANSLDFVQNESHFDQIADLLSCRWGAGFHAVTP